MWEDQTVLARLHESLRRWTRRSDGRVSAARLEDRLQDRRNNFDVLRLLAASLVLFSHSYALTASTEPFADVSGWTLGEVGVVMFFAMSGFLIAKSWSDQPRLVPFAVKRALRLLPALFVAVSVTVFVVGPLFTTLPLGTYFTDPTTWVYWVRSSLLITIRGTLPGVFETNPFPDAVNGSLWTLPVEACCYAMAAAFGLLGLLRRSRVARRARLPAPPGRLAAVALSNAPAGGTTGGNLSLVVMLGATFVLGNLAYSLRSRLHLSWILLAVLTVLWVVTWSGDWTRAVGVPAIAFAVLVFAFRTPAWLRRLTAPGDVSYGIYVYAFPVQQSVAAIWPGIDPLVMFAIAFPVTYGLAFLSWRLVERPALALKRVVAPRRPEPDRHEPGQPRRSLTPSFDVRGRAAPLVESGPVSTTPSAADQKARVRGFWEEEPCGVEHTATAGRHARVLRRGRADARRARPRTSTDSQTSKVLAASELLEIGVGLGTDFIRFVRAGAIATGVDLTDHAVELVKRRLALEGLSADVRTADAESLPFDDARSTVSTRGACCITRPTAPRRSVRRCVYSVPEARPA